LPLHNEDKEFQIELVKLQIRQAHISSTYTMLLSITISLMLMFFSVYIPLYIYTQNMFFLNIILIAVPILFALTLASFLDYKNKEKRLSREIEELKKKYIW